MYDSGFTAEKDKDDVRSFKGYNEWSLFAKKKTVTYEDITGNMGNMNAISHLVAHW